MKKNTLTYYNPQGVQITSKNRNLLIREDDRVEWVCPHGIGHAVGHLRKWEEWMWVHGCDGDCRQWDYALGDLKHDPLV